MRTSLKNKDTGIVSEKELYEHLTALGYDIVPEFINHIPYGIGGYSNKEGMLTDGRIHYGSYYNLKWAIKFMEDLKEFDLQGKLRHRGVDYDNRLPLYISADYLDGKFTYPLDKVIDFVKAVNKMNLRDKLKERGYEPDQHMMKYICSHLGNYKDGLDTFDLESVIEFINSTTEYNLKTKIEEMGYRFTTELIQGIREHDPPLKVSKNRYTVYDWEKVKEYVIKNAPKRITMDTKEKLVENNFFGNDLKENYEQVGNISQHFPLIKWYSGRFNTIPDVCYVGYLSVWEVLQENNFKNLKWYYKGLSYISKPDDYLYPEMLRYFTEREVAEYIREALIEIEEGMFLMLTDGYFKYSEKDIDMNARAYLVYKEGIHDPSDVLKYLSDMFVQHNVMGTLGLLYHDSRGFGTQDFTIPKPEIDFNLHYNTGFEKVHQTILSALKQDKGKGLVLLHGRPGTGKTSYIRYLINLLNKNKIFVPPNLTGMLSDPGFIPFLMENSNCVLFIEDAEDVLRSRDDGYNNQAVSNILNITDGLLSDCLNIQIVATFNTHLKNIDEALLRKGRLIAQYEFRELEPSRAEKLGDHLKVWLDDTRNLTLADIYSAKLKKDKNHR